MIRKESETEEEFGRQGESEGRKGEEVLEWCGKRRERERMGEGSREEYVHTRRKDWQE